MKTLVAGIGNIFLGDDGFGSEVAQRLRARGGLPDGVKVEDFGIRGVHLAYELLEGYDALVLVDALPSGEAPGTVTLFEPDIPQPASQGDDVAPVMDSHSMEPGSVLGMLAQLGGRVDRVLVVGCEPVSLDEGIGLSRPVAGAVDHAVDAVIHLVGEL